MKLSKKARRAAVTAVIANFATGPQYCWSIIGAAFAASYGWSATQQSFPYAVQMILSNLCGIIAGRISDYWKPKYGMLIGAVCFGGGLAVAGMTSSLWLIAISMGVFGMGANLVTTNTSSSAVKLAPMNVKGKISGISTSAIALASLYAAPMMTAMKNSWGINNTLIYCGFGFLALLAALSFFMPTPERGGRAVEEEDTSIYKNSVDPVKALRKYETWVMFGCMLCAAIGGQLVISQASNIAVLQANWDKGFVLVMVIAAGNTLGRLLMTSLSDKIGCFKAWKLIFTLSFINLCLFSLYKTPALLVAGTLIAGVTYGACIGLGWATVESVYGKRYLGSIFGYVVIGNGVAAIIGPMLAAAFADATGTYTAAFLIFAAVQIVGFALSCTVKDRCADTAAQKH